MHAGAGPGYAPQMTQTLMHTDFGGLAVAYDNRVLEPRAWTVAQSRWAEDLLRTAPPGPVLELCAGVGHIGLRAVAHRRRDLVMVDLDEHACELARANVLANRPLGVVDVRQGRLDQVLRPGELFSGIIADPPWVPSHDVRRFPRDPLRAIDGGRDGLDVARQCVRVIDAHLTSYGWALLQLGTPAQARDLAVGLASARDLDLDVVEIRTYGDRGVLVRLGRRDG
jgi:methylase of polypeptide subunit release factors